jgi:hypothetical protein
VELHPHPHPHLYAFMACTGTALTINFVLKTHTTVASALKSTVLPDSTSKQPLNFTYHVYSTVIAKSIHFVLQNCWLPSFRRRIYYLDSYAPICNWRNRNRPVGTDAGLRDGQPWIYVSIPDRVKRIFSLKCSDRLWGPPCFLVNGHRGLFPRR